LTENSEDEFSLIAGLPNLSVRSFFTTFASAESKKRLTEASLLFIKI